MTLEPYLFFNGRCEEAIAFYKEAIGAKRQAAKQAARATNCSIFKSYSFMYHAG